MPILSDLSAIIAKIFTLLSVSSLFIGAVAFFKVYIAYLLMELDPCLEICCVGFLTTFSVYGINKLTDMDEDAINMPERLSFLAGRRRLVLFYSIAAYIFSVLLVYLQEPSAIPIIFIPIAANIAYSYRLTPWLPRLKNIPIMKNVFVAFTWASVTALLVGLYVVPLGGVLIVFTFLFVKSFMNTVLYDIRDLEGDRDSGVRTIPVLLGARSATIILLTLNSALLLWVLLADITIPFLAVILVLYGYAYILFFRKRRSSLARDIFVDGEWILAVFILVLLNGVGLLT